MATITVGENSYVTVAEAEAYVADRGEAFTGDVSQQLIKAMDYLSLQDWSGYKTDEDQDLDFPRNGDTEAPAKIETAQIVIALTYDAGNDPMANTEPAVKREKVDVIEVEYQDNETGRTSYTQINALLKPYLSGNSLYGSGTFEIHKGAWH
jgi:hypothetical protein